MNDIDILRCFMEAMGTQYNVEREKQSLEKLLKERQSDKEKINEQLIEIISYQEKLLNAYIPKSLIKEKIEELKERLVYYQNLKLPKVDDNGVKTGLIVNETIMVLKAKIQVLEELLNKNVK